MSSSFLSHHSRPKSGAANSSNSNSSIRANSSNGSNSANSTDTDGDNMSGDDDGGVGAKRGLSFFFLLVSNVAAFCLAVAVVGVASWVIADDDDGLR